QYFPDSYRDFIEHVMPVLRDRGLAQREYAPGTLREKIFPEIGPTLPDRHVAASKRGAFDRADEMSGSNTGVSWQKRATA
ncbi:LLM class flavin-dependent oxidoreductase, partial [Mycobacterium hodleri]